VHNLTLVSLDAGVHGQRKNEQKADDPDHGTDDKRIATGPVTDGLEWVNGSQVAIYAH